MQQVHINFQQDEYSFGRSIIAFDTLIERKRFREGQIEKKEEARKGCSRIWSLGLPEFFLI